METEVSVRLVVSREVEVNREGSKRRRELTVIDGDPRRSFELERGSLAAEIERDAGGDYRGEGGVYIGADGS